MSPRTNYDQLASQIDYAKVKQKLQELMKQRPPKRRQTAADVLAPIGDHLRELRAKGWTYRQLIRELNEGGVPVKVGTLRNYLTGREHARKKTGVRRGSKRGQGGGAGSGR